MLSYGITRPVENANVRPLIFPVDSVECVSRCVILWKVLLGKTLDKLRMVRHACNTVLKRLRQEDHEFKAFLGYRDIPILL